MRITKPGVLITALLAIAGIVCAEEVRYQNFTDVSHFVLNGAASSIRQSTGNTPALRLTDALEQSSSAFLQEPVKIAQDASFSTYFQFRITQPMGWTDSDKIKGADGIAFVIQTQAASIGGSGGDIGYGGINNSIAIEFDTWNNGESDRNNGNHIGININGDTTSIALQEHPAPFNNGRVWHSWIDYDGRKKLLEIRISANSLRPPKPALSHSLDLIQILQRPEVFIGFSSGTGSAGNVHEILSWQFQGDFAPIQTATLIELNFVRKTGNSFEKIEDAVQYKQVFFVEAIYNIEPQGDERNVQLKNIKGLTQVTVKKTKANPKLFRSKPIILSKTESE